jgi:hypothetical protein
MSNFKLSEVTAILGTIDPQSVASTTVTSDGVTLELYNRIMAVVQIGAAAAGSAGEIVLFKAEDSSATNSTELVSQEIDGDDDNKQYVLDYSGPEVDQAKPYIFVKVTSDNSNAILASAVIYGGQARYFAPDGNLASVTILD